MKALDGFHDRCLCLIVQCRSSLVQDQDLRLIIEGSGYTDSLALAAGETHAAFADLRIQTVLQAIDKIPQLCPLQGILHPLFVDLLFLDTKGNIATDGIIQQINALGNIADLVMPGIQVLEDILPAYHDLALGGFQDPQDHIRQRSLAGTGLTDEGNRAVLRNIQGKVIQHLFLIIRVGEGNVLYVNGIRQNDLSALCPVLPNLIQALDLL